MLPSDFEFLSYLEERHGVNLTSSDIQALNEFHFHLRNQTAVRLASDPEAVFYDVQNGKILGIIAFAAIGFFAAPLLGVGGIIGALMGAAIGFRLFGSKKKKEEEEQQRAPAQAYGFDSVAALPSIGGPIPLIYCDRDTNPNGGVLTSGFVVNSRVETRMGVQRLYQLVVLGYGQFGSIDQAGMTINDQPRINYFEDEVITKVALGLPNQAPFPEFPYYSQAISPAAQNQMGLDSRAILETTTSSSTIVLKEEDVTAFSPGDSYRHAGQSFRLKAKTTTSVIADKVINQTNAQPVYAYWNANYTTSKRVTEIQVNLNAQYWAVKQDKDSKEVEDVNLANVWDIYLTSLTTQVRTKLARIHIKSKTKTNLRRTFLIQDLPLSKYKLELITITRDEQPVGEQTYALKDDGVLRSFPVANGWTLTLEGGVLEAVRDDNSYTDRTQWAAQGGAPCQITSVNEIVYPGAIGQLSVVGYPGMPMIGLVATASAQLQGQPNLKGLIRKGRSRMRVLGGSSIAFAGSSNNDLRTADAYLQSLSNVGFIKVGDILRNLDKRTESTITSINLAAGQIVTAQSCNWSNGDRWLIYHYGCSNYFPDIYADTLTSFDGGLGNFIDADFFVDYNSIIDSKIYCKLNGFFWDGIIASPTPWAQWATRESLGSLLFPSRISGKFALIPEQRLSMAKPIALFNASNIIEGSFNEEFAERQDLNTLIVSYKNGEDEKFETKTITIQTLAAYNGEVPVVEESLGLDSVTNFSQAEKIGQVYLKTRLLQDRAISFKTGLQGSYITPGDLIYVQHLITEFDRECSGFVQFAGCVLQPNGTYTCNVRLSAPVRQGIGEEAGYVAAIFRLQDGGMQTDLPLISYLEPTIQEVLLAIQGLQVPLQQPGENRNGDYVCVSKITEQKRIYRVNSIDPQPDGTVGIGGVIWLPNMLTSEGLVTIN
jgi:hypothetical protein